MGYKILCWIRVETAEPNIYATKEEAQKEVENCRLMQPENIYRIVRVSKKELPNKISS